MYVTLVNLTKDIFSKPSPSSILEDAKPFSIRGLYELTKPRLSLLSVFTASLGFLVHDPLKSDFSLFLLHNQDTIYRKLHNLVSEIKD